MLGIVVAMEKEGKLFLDECQIENTEYYAGKKIYKGVFENKEFVLIISGIGKVNSGMATQIIIDRYNVEYIINFGVAGGKKDSELSAGDVALLRDVCQYDFDLSEIDDVSVGYMQDYDLVYYPTAFPNYHGNAFKLKRGASGDRFTKNKYWLELIHTLGGEVVDMECAGIAQVAYANKKPVYILKLISDVDGEEESIFSQYANNVKSVCEKIPNAVRELLKNI